MKIIYKQGNFLEGPEKFILHGCNAQGVMGSGAAHAVRTKYPDAYQLYRSLYLDYGLKLGELQYSEQTNGVVVFNGITQYNYGRDPNTVYVDYDAVEEVIKELNVFVGEQYSYPNVAMPKIGAGLGNGDWNIISAIIENNSPHFVPVVYVL